MILQRAGGRQECEVGETLWEVPEEVARDGVDLLRQETDIVRAAARALEDVCSFIVPSHTREGLGQPERAR